MIAYFKWGRGYKGKERKGGEGVGIGRFGEESKRGAGEKKRG